MGQLNLYYRAFKEYRKYTLKDKACIKQRQRIKDYSSENDKLETVRTSCIIDENWVEQIEIGLPFVEKAIAEERQFIKNEGEVLDIEKIKRVSKDSVEHLARHSEFITHVPEDGKDVIPDKIYMVERLSDYAVYENRFLYMLLCYLRDFIDLRLKKIKELRNTYKANTYIKRDMLTSSGRIFFEATLKEESKKDPYSVFDQNSLSLIGRIESCQHIVTSLLAKPLMVIVAKTPMIKPPITKTNVLKMNTKFKNSVSLYEYLAAYQGLGYEIVETKKTYSPFTDEIVDDLAEVVNLTSFLTYEYGNELNVELLKGYEQEERDKKDAEMRKLLSDLEELKAKLASKEINTEEYLYSLEKTLSEFREENEKLKVVEKEHYLLRDKHDELKQEKSQLSKKLYEEEKLNEQLDFKMHQMEETHQKELTDAEERRVKDLEDQKNALNADFTRISEEREQQYNSELTAVKEQAENEYLVLSNQFNELTKKHDLVKAELHSVKGEQGLMDDEDFSSEEKFKELEREFVAFYDVFKAKWKDAKKRIRQDVLWKKFKKIRDQIEEDEGTQDQDEE